MANWKRGNTELNNPLVNEREENLCDLVENLKAMWATQAGVHLRRENPSISEHIGIYLEYGFDEPSVMQAFTSWLDRVKAYVMHKEL